MKKISVSGFLCAGLAALAVSCSQSDFPGTETTGRGGFAPEVALNSEILTGSRQKAPSRAEAADVTAADLGLRLIGSDGAVVKTWAKLADFDATERFNVGSYTLEAFYGDEETEGFEAPYFYGSQNIKIEENKVTPAALTASLANSMLSLEYTENFTNYMSDYSAEVHSAAGATTAYAKDEVRPVYVKAGLVEVYVSFTKPNGKSAKILSASFTAKARTHYHVTFDLSTESSDAVLKVIYDDRLEMETVEIDLSDELLNMPAPEVTPEGFTSDEAIKFVPGFAPSTPLKLNIIARGKLARVNMTTHSASLLGQGWPAETNLVNAAEGVRSTLASLGLTARSLYTNPDKMAVIDLTKVLEHITLVDGGDGITTITFVVVDAMGKASDEVTLRLENAPLAVSLENPGTLLVGASQLILDLNYNGGKPEGAVEIQYFNDRGTWTTATAAYEVAGEGVFTATLTGLPAATGDLRLRAVAGKLISEELVVKRENIDLVTSSAASEVFATTATVSASLPARATIDLAGVLSNSKLMVSANGGAYTAATATVEGNTYHVTGLAPGTSYKARVEGAGINSCTEVAFTTEAAAQLPNADMETWYRWKKATSHCYWFIDYPGADENAVWGTVNKLTTSQGGSGVFNTDKYAYVANSGTIETSDAHGGSKAACVRTVGWGKGSTAVGSGSANCKNLTAGELYLGTYNESTKAAEYSGIAFTSRPASLSFYYKYEAYNSADYGYAEIKVLDASGKLVASGSKNLGSAASYTLATIPVNYAAGAAKAAKITVIFKSTGNASCLEIKSENVKGPDFGNLSDGEYVGSKLFVDDITLNY